MNKPNTIYVAHVLSKDIASRIISFGSYMNGWESVNYAHTALIYTNKKGKQILIEAHPKPGVYSQEFIEKEYKGDSTKIAYTALNGLIDDVNTIEIFENFLNEKYTNGKNLYSVAKALKSFDFQDLEVNSWIKIYKESAEKSAGNGLRYWLNVAVGTVTSSFDWLRNKVRQGTNHAGKSFVDITSYILSYFSLKEKDYMESLRAKEEANTESSKVLYFYCTELVVTILRDWCKTRNIELPSIINGDDISFQNPEQIYPQELVTSIEKHGKQHIAPTML